MVKYCSVDTSMRIWVHVAIDASSAAKDDPSISLETLDTRYLVFHSPSPSILFCKQIMVWMCDMGGIGGAFLCVNENLQMGLLAGGRIYTPRISLMTRRSMPSPWNEYIVCSWDEVYTLNCQVKWRGPSKALGESITLSGCRTVWIVCTERVCFFFILAGIQLMAGTSHRIHGSKHHLRSGGFCTSVVDPTRVPRFKLRLIWGTIDKWVRRG